LSQDSEEISHTRTASTRASQELEKLRQDYEDKLKRLETNEKQELKAAHAEAQRIVDDVSRRMDELMKQYQDSLKSQPQAAREVKREVEVTREELVQQPNRWKRRRRSLLSRRYCPETLSSLRPSISRLSSSMS